MSGDPQDLGSLREAEGSPSAGRPFRDDVVSYGKSLAPNSAWSLFPGAADLRHYDRRWLRPDLVAGITVAAIAIPQSLGMAELAGLPVVAGLYATLLPLVAYALFGSSRQLVVGPEGTLAALTAVVVAPLAAGDPARYAPLAAMLAVLVGGILILSGVLRLGFMAEFFSRPILLGYINGIALSIIAGQIPKLLGLDIEADDFFLSLAEIARDLGSTHWPTFALGGSLLAFLLVLRRVSPLMPAALVVVIGSTALVAVFDLEADGIAVVGQVDGGLPRPALPDLGLGDITDLLLPAVGLALVSLADTVATGRTFAQKNGYELDSNRELVGLGAAGVAAGFSQAFPISSSGSRTAANDAAGGRSQAVGLVAVLAVALILLFATGLLETLPTAALGAVVIAAALGLFDLAGFRELRRVRGTEVALALVALLGVLVFGVLGGVAVAVGLSIGLYLYRAVRPHDAVLGDVENVDGFHDVDRFPTSQTRPGLLVYRFDAPIFFPNAEYFKTRVLELVAAADPPPRWLLLNAEAVVYMDSTAVAALARLQQELSDRGIVLAAARVKGPLRDLWQRTGLTAAIGEQHMFPTVRAGVRAYDERAGESPG
jgi:sulfate permease, SulP family